MSQGLLIISSLHICIGIQPKMEQRGSVKVLIEIENSKCDFADLDMYNVPPLEYHSYSSLSNACQHRIDLYKELERFREDHRNREDRKEFYLGAANIIDRCKSKFMTDKLDDAMSHWILKLVFNNVDQGTFLINESLIFIARVYSQARRYAQVRIRGTSDEERLKNRKELARKFYFDILLKYLGVLGTQKNQKSIKIPFKLAARLIERYEVELHNGFAIITPDNAFTALQELFGEILHVHNKNVEKIHRQLMRQDSRIEKLVDLLKEYCKSSEHYYKMERAALSTKIDASNMDYAVREHFPLCMSEIVEGLKGKHQLKHWGRLQLGLFLKGIGIRIEDNMTFFNSHLSKLPDAKKKMGEYKYYIEHMYGKRGKKTDYTPWSCQKIAEKAIPAGNDVYGCPFKFYSDANLAKAMKMRKLDDKQTSEVIAARKASFQLGCRKLFEVSNKVSKAKPGVGKHPNSYYLSSYFSKRSSKEPVPSSSLTI